MIEYYVSCVSQIHLSSWTLLFVYEKENACARKKGV